MIRFCKCWNFKELNSHFYITKYFKCKIHSICILLDSCILLFSVAIHCLGGDSCTKWIIIFAHVCSISQCNFSLCWTSFIFTLLQLFSVLKYEFHHLIYSEEDSNDVHSIQRESYQRRKSIAKVLIDYSLKQMQDLKRYLNNSAGFKVLHILCFIYTLDPLFNRPQINEKFCSSTDKTCHSSFYIYGKLISHS